MEAALAERLAEVLETEAATLDAEALRAGSAARAAQSRSDAQRQLHRRSRSATTALPDGRFAALISPPRLRISP